MKIFTLVAVLFGFNLAQAQLSLYTDRPVETMQVIADAYQKKTGVTVDITSFSYTDLKKTLVNEGAGSPADMVIVKDLVYLTDLTDSQLLQPLNSPFVKQSVDPSMQSQYWTAITFRARTLVYDKAYDVSGINSYADLADPNYRGQLCLRTSVSSYNEILVASMINSYGVDETYDILDGWLNNLADFTKIHTSDTTIIKDIARRDGTCTLGITNSYYLGAQLLENPNLPVGIKYLNLKDGGVSTNGIGGAIAASSKNADLAKDFIEFTLSKEMQEYFSTSNQDFPANTNVSFPQNIQAWEGFVVNPIHWETLSSEISTARDLFDELDYQ